MTRPATTESFAPLAATLPPGPAEIHAQLQALAGRRVAVALSGGVDSAVAALRLKRAGADVVALALRLHDVDPSLPAAPRACCAPDDLQDARRVAEALDVPLYVMDARAAFEEAVVEPFVGAYFSGQTPAPCVACNARVKLGRLWERARVLGAEALATGHYARTTRDGRLYRGVDREKDQSYFLFSTPSPVLRDLVLPLGAAEKRTVRAEALASGLPVAHKLDSQEVCFVGGSGAKGFLRRRAGERDGGAIVDSEGRELGRHDGFWQYTVGQRRGTGVAGGRRLYVLRVEAESRTVVVGDDAELLERALSATSVRWISRAPSGSVRARVKIRSRDPGTSADVHLEPDGSVEVRFDQPVRAIAPGQAAVFYVDDEVIGGGFIRGACG
ncbi:MAG: tRNA 2-thiouridine(34) synthase MnmA [Deltaproteobacteria bacterium]|nr:tRNA 2-thiouridine(34) synthase MnmA [Deltaproteobacteria bacterium]